MTGTPPRPPRAASLFPAAAPDGAQPPVPDWARALFAGRPAPGAAAGDPGRPPRRFRLEVDGIVTRIDLPEVGGVLLESIGAGAGAAVQQAAVRLRLAPVPAVHAPGLRGLPERGGAGRRPLPPMVAVARLIRRVQHGLPASDTRYDPCFRLRLYPMLSGRPLAGELRALNRRLRPLRRLLARVPLVPAHNRLVPARLRDVGQGLQALGWEMADSNDPVWDPAVYAQAAGLDEAQAARLLAAVLGRPPRLAERARLTLYRAMAPAIEGAEADLRRGRGAAEAAEAPRRARAYRSLQRQLAAPGLRAAIGVLGRNGRRALP